MSHFIRNNGLLFVLGVSVLSYLYVGVFGFEAFNAVALFSVFISICAVTVLAYFQSVQALLANIDYVKGWRFPVIHVDISAYFQLTRHNVVMLGLIQVGMLVTGMLATTAIRISHDASGIEFYDFYWFSFWRPEAFLMPIIWAFCAGAVHEGDQWSETSEAGLALIGILLTLGIGFLFSVTVAYSAFGWFGDLMF